MLFTEANINYIYWPLNDEEAYGFYQKLFSRYHLKNYILIKGKVFYVV